jgi:DNA-binding NtrC family response regulator
VTAKILIVDDELNVRVFLKDVLSNEGYRICEAATGQETLALAQQERPDIIILDLKLPDADGIELIPKLKEIRESTEIIVITALSTVDNAVKSIRNGAYDFITKPFDIDKINISVTRALEYLKLGRENRVLKRYTENRVYFEEFVGESGAIKETLAMLPKLQEANVPILITGETGTGKNVLAKQIHFMLVGSDAPIAYVDCTTIPKDIFESELFGHEAGAFTGATSRRTGRVEEADNGTLILDEIAEIPVEFQSKLLYFIQEKSFFRIGGNKPRTVKVRIIALSNRNLEAEIASGAFREDLYYRLNLIHINIPPLRERPEDILVLADYFLASFNRQYTKKIRGITTRCQEKMLQAPWKGNARELKNKLERACLLCEGGKIDIGDLALNEDSSPGSNGSLKRSMDDHEKSLIIKTLAKNNGNRTRTAKELEISLRNLHHKLTKYDLYTG